MNNPSDRWREIGDLIENLERLVAAQRIVDTCVNFDELDDRAEAVRRKLVKLKAAVTADIERVSLQLLTSQVGSKQHVA